MVEGNTNNGQCKVERELFLNNLILVPFFPRFKFACLLY